MSGTSPILTYGFGTWGGASLLPTLGFGIGEDTVVYATYFPSLTGPSAHLRTIEGPSAELYTLRGPSQKQHDLAGPYG